jgi:hypothetical protein
MSDTSENIKRVSEPPSGWKRKFNPLPAARKYGEDAMSTDTDLPLNLRLLIRKLGFENAEALHEERIRIHDDITIDGARYRLARLMKWMSSVCSLSFMITDADSDHKHMRAYLKKIAQDETPGVPKEIKIAARQYEKRSLRDLAVCVADAKVLFMEMVRSDAERRERA